MTSRRLRFGRLSVYIEPRDIWVGVYVAKDAVYVCPVPLLVFRWQRRGVDPDPLDYAMFTVWLEGNWRWLTQKMTTEARESAVAAVVRYSTQLRAKWGDSEPPLSEEDLAWWR